jgi:hypothetical protein
MYKEDNSMVNVLIMVLLIVQNLKHNLVTFCTIFSTYTKVVVSVEKQRGYVKME